MAYVDCSSVGPAFRWSEQHTCDQESEELMFRRSISDWSLRPAALELTFAIILPSDIDSPVRLSSPSSMTLKRSFLSVGFALRLATTRQFHSTDVDQFTVMTGTSCHILSRATSNRVFLSSSNCAVALRIIHWTTAGLRARRSHSLKKLDIALMNGGSVSI
jgi:hypothetical protein